MRIGLALVTAAPLLLGACFKDPTVTVELRRDGELVFECGDASMSELTPKPGGWAFKCGGGTSVYVTYDTGEGPAKGTIKQILVTNKPGSETEFVAAYVGRDEGCEVEAGDKGPAALPTGRGGVEPGTYAIAMGKPCATLELTIK